MKILSSAENDQSTRNLFKWELYQRTSVSAV
jgi:hypothetical protein